MSRTRPVPSGADGRPHAPQQARRAAGVAGIPLLPLALTAFVAFAVYAGALFNDFVIDDIQQVLQNPWLKDVRYMPDIFLKGVWEFAGTAGNYYRPVMHLIYMLNYHLFGYHPWGYHLVNILFHTGSSVLVLLLACEIFRCRTARGPWKAAIPATAAALLFALHPVHTEAVAWVGALPEVSYTFFFLLSFLLYIRFRDGGGRYLLPLSAAAFFLATLCKEPAFTLPVILAAYEYAFREGTIDLRGILRRLAPFLAAGAVSLALRIIALGGMAPASGQISLSAGGYVLNIVPLFMQYIEKVLLPVGLNAFYTFHPVTVPPGTRAVVSLLLFPLFLILSILLARKSRTAFIGILLFTVPLLPALYIQGLAGGISFAERYLYLPTAGFALLAALCIRAAASSRRGAATASAVLAAVLVLYGAGTAARTAVWKDSYTIWSDTVRKSPDSDVAQGNLGYVLCADRGRIDEGLEHLKTALRLNPSYAGTYINIGNAYLSKRMIEQAVASFREALRLKPGYAQAHYGLGLAYDALGDQAASFEQYALAVRINPFYAEAHNNLGIAYAQRGEIGKAIPQFEEAVRLNPDDEDFRVNLSQAYARRVK